MEFLIRKCAELCELRASVVNYRLLILSLAVLSIPSDILSATSVAIKLVRSDDQLSAM